MKNWADRLAEQGVMCQEAVKWAKNYPTLVDAWVECHNSDFMVRLLDHVGWPDGVRAEYERMRTPAKAEFDRRTAPAKAKLDRAKAPAWAEYKRATALAEAEYERVATPIRVEYDRICTDALRKLVPVPLAVGES